MSKLERVLIYTLIILAITLIWALIFGFDSKIPMVPLIGVKDGFFSTKK